MHCPFLSWENSLSSHLKLGMALGSRHENDPGGQQDLDKVPRALTHIAYVAAPSLHQPFPLVGCVMVHLLRLVLVPTLCESLAVTLLRQFGSA